MRIIVYLSPGTVNIYPDPATVSLGSTVSWLVQTAGLRKSTPLRLTVYFDHGTPFDSKRFARDVKSDADGACTAPIDGDTAQTPGDYKYGLKAEQDGDIVIDIDPHLIVR